MVEKEHMTRSNLHENLRPRPVIESLRRSRDEVHTSLSSQYSLH